MPPPLAPMLARLARCFPEVVEPLLALPQRRLVLDGELVVARGGALDFEARLARLHPAASRVERLRRETLATLVPSTCSSSTTRTWPWPTVATPVAWEEVERAAAERRPELLSFGLDEVLARVERHGDLLAPLR